MSIDRTFENYDKVKSYLIQNREASLSEICDGTNVGLRETYELVQRMLKEGVIVVVRDEC